MKQNKTLSDLQTNPLIGEAFNLYDDHNFSSERMVLDKIGLE